MMPERESAQRADNFAEKSQRKDHDCGREIDGQIPDSRHATADHPKNRLGETPRDRADRSENRSAVAHIKPAENNANNADEYVDLDCPADEPHGSSP